MDSRFPRVYVLVSATLSKLRNTAKEKLNFSSQYCTFRVVRDSKGGLGYKMKIRYYVQFVGIPRGIRGRIARTPHSAQAFLTTRPVVSKLIPRPSSCWPQDLSGLPFEQPISPERPMYVEIEVEAS